MFEEAISMKKIFALTLMLIFALSNFCFAAEYDITNSGNRKHDFDGGYLQAWQDDGSDILYDKYPLLGGGDSDIYYLDPTSCNRTVKDNRTFVGAIVHNIAGGVNPDGTPEFYSVLVFKFETFFENGDRKIILDEIILQSKETYPQKKSVLNEDITDDFMKYDDGLAYHIFQRAWGVTEFSS